MNLPSEIKAEAERLMNLSLAAKKRGDYAKADDLYAESLFCLRLLKAAGEDVEGVAR